MAASLFKYIRARVPTEQDAEDLMQETLLESWLRQEAFRDDSSLLTWQIGIAKRLIVNLHRKEYGRYGISERQRFYAHQVKQNQILEDRYCWPRIDTDLDVKFMLEGIPEDDAYVLKERFMHGESSKEVAKRLDITFNAVDCRVKKAKQSAQLYFLGGD